MQTAKQFHEVRVQSTDADLVDRSLGRFLHDLVDLGTSLADHLLDARGVDAPIDEKSLERTLGDLSSDRVESRDDDRLGGVVDDQVDSRERLEGADVPALATDHPSLHV